MVYFSLPFSLSSSFSFSLLFFFFFFFFFVIKEREREMLPNSRIIPPLNNKNSRSRSSSTSGYESNSKKGFISRLLANPNTPSNYQYPPKTKYESVLGINNDKDYATWGRPADPKVNFFLQQTIKINSVKIPIAFFFFKKHFFIK